TVLAASEFAFPWMASVARLLFVMPFTAVAAAFAAWRDARDRAPKISGARKPKPPRLAPAPESPPSKPRITAAVPATTRDPEAETPQLTLPRAGDKKATPKPAKAARPRVPAPARAERESAAEEPADETFPSLSLLSMPVQQEDLITAADLTAEANLLVA